MNKELFKVVLVLFVVLTTTINVYAEMNIVRETEPMVVASEDYTIALRSDGTIVITGDHPFTRYESWTDIQQIVTDRGSLIGITSKGKILLDGVAAESNQKIIDEWSDIKSVTTNAGYIAAVKNDGTVVMTNGEVNWEDVVDIVPLFSRNCNGFLAIKKDNTILFKNYSFEGTEGIAKAFAEFTDVKKLATSYYNVVCLRNDGTVISYLDLGGAITERPWVNVVDVTTYESGNIFALLETGTVEYIDANSVEGERYTLWQDMKAISAGTAHVVGICEDGKVLASGNNEYGQCNVESWDLTPLAGDANDDNNVNAKDALVILQKAAQLNDYGTAFIPGEWSPENAMLTNDSLEIINAEDALEVLKISAKIK